MIDDKVIQRIAQISGVEISENISYPARHAKFLSVPPGLHPDVGNRIKALYPHGLYSHQAKAIEYGLVGRSVCVATPTASGKTLIFTSIAISYLLRSKGSVVLALYPAKALLHDQERKWHDSIRGSSLKLAIIDGGVEIKQRSVLIAQSQIILMTPDVLHAWLMAKLDQPDIRKFLASLGMIILDEAHIYDGIFGTNMAYLLRRLQAVSVVTQFLASSATIGDPIGFLLKLTGVNFNLISADDDGASAPEKEILLCRIPIRKTSKFLTSLIQEYASGGNGRFLIFADSRKRVEELAAEGHRILKKTSEQQSDESNNEDSDLDDTLDKVIERMVLPYRAGYEEEDRANIQKALTHGTLQGVISTSALELGIDIGDIGLVILLGEPPSVKSFWQRAGRAGRQNRGVVALLDLDGHVTSMGLGNYLDRPPEPNWLYLDNEYLQYANALCAAEEQLQMPENLYSRKPFAILPDTFLELLDNEIKPTRSIPHDLYPLKQQALGSPHRAFPLRSGIEKSYQVTCSTQSNQRLGSLSYSQVLHEAFPGAIYRYLATPYRIFQLKHAKGDIIAHRTTGFGRTNPIIQTAVFPQFTDQMYYIRHSEQAFITECRVQVSERVIGFVEQYGQNKKEILYGVGNTYSQKPLNRYIDTTGVCFYFADEFLQRDKLGKYICLAFCKYCSVQDRDVGWGTFISQTSPLGVEPIKGFAIYDSAYGSLRLTRQIPLHLEDILLEAVRIAIEEKAPQVASGVVEIMQQIESFGQEQENILTSNIFDDATDNGWITVVAPEQMAILHDGQAHINEEVTVLRYIYTPQGIRYTLKATHIGLNWQVCANMIHPINGVTKLEKYNINTGEVKVFLS
ncbi:MAG: DEAD/DEAH box helicase [Candidatus Methylumidiphilus sp.]